MTGRAAALFAAIGLLLLLGSCVSPAEVRRRDEAGCAGYGFKPGTDAFAACLQRQDLVRQYILLNQPYWGPHHFW